MDRDTAVEIINEFNSSAEYEKLEIPVEDSEIIDLGILVHTKAKELFADGDRTNVVQTIIFLGDSVVPKDDVIHTYPRRSSGGLSESDERETKDYPKKAIEIDEQFRIAVDLDDAKEIARREKLPIPHQIEGDPDPMPRDLSELLDKQIRRLSGEYNAYLGRTTYLLGVESSDLANSEHLLESARAKALRGLDLQDPNSDTKKQKLAKVIDAEILADPLVTELTKSVSEHQQGVIILKALKEIYSGNVDRLSREWTMRQNEWEKSR